MSIYNDPVKYAKETRIPITWAQKWCAKQLELKKEIDAARICPKCNKPTLVLEMGSYEECINDYVYCENDEIPAVDVDGEEFFEECDYTAEPKGEHEPLSSWYDFDPILALSGSAVSGFGSLTEWIRFVKTEIMKLEEPA